MRILYLETLLDGLQGLTIAAILHIIKELAGEEQLEIVIDVRSDMPSLHVTLEKLGFSPTIYYPCYIEHKNMRVDGVQYSYLHNYTFRESLSWVKILYEQWPQAASVIDAVSDLHTSNNKGVTH